jgi:hypothetical protein
MAFDDSLITYCETTAPIFKMDEALLEHWMSHPKTLPDWNEALLAYKRCVEALPEGFNVCVTADMLFRQRRSFNVKHKKFEPLREYCFPRRMTDPRLL